MIKRNRLDGTFEVYARTTHWMVRGPAAGYRPDCEDAARAVIDREAGFDPDIWVLEIEDRDGKYELDGPIIA